jgi:hypothetical protein
MRMPIGTLDKMTSNPMQRKVQNTPIVVERNGPKTVTKKPNVNLKAVIAPEGDW